MKEDVFACKICGVLSPRTDLPCKGWRKCKDCMRKYQKAFREKNKERLRLYNQQYRIEKKVEISLQRKQFRIENAERLRLNNRINWAKNGEKYSAQHYQRKVQRLKTDLCFKLRETIRSRIAMAIRGSAKRGSAIELLGCTIEEFKQYIEAKFQPGMTWGNWSLKGWHLDHIKPIASFDLSDPKQLAEACHFTNMQPLWAKDNLDKRMTDRNTRNAG